MIVGTQHEVVWINNEGLYSMGNNNWKGTWTHRPSTQPLLYENYTPLQIIKNIISQGKYYFKNHCIIFIVNIIFIIKQ